MRRLGIAREGSFVSWLGDQSAGFAFSEGASALLGVCGVGKGEQTTVDQAIQSLVSGEQQIEQELTTLQTQLNVDFSTMEQTITSSNYWASSANLNAVLKPSASLFNGFYTDITTTTFTFQDNSYQYLEILMALASLKANDKAFSNTNFAKTKLYAEMQTFFGNNNTISNSATSLQSQLRQKLPDFNTMTKVLGNYLSQNLTQVGALSSTLQKGAGTKSVVEQAVNSMQQYLLTLVPSISEGSPGPDLINNLLIPYNNALFLQSGQVIATIQGLYVIARTALALEYLGWNDVDSNSTLTITNPNGSTTALNGSTLPGAISVIYSSTPSQYQAALKTLNSSYNQLLSQIIQLYKAHVYADYPLGSTDSFTYLQAKSLMPPGSWTQSCNVLQYSKSKPLIGSYTGSSMTAYCGLTSPAKQTLNFASCNDPTTDQPTFANGALKCGQMAAANPVYGSQGYFEPVATGVSGSHSGYYVYVDPGEAVLTITNPGNLYATNSANTWYSGGGWGSWSETIQATIGTNSEFRFNISAYTGQPNQGTIFSLYLSLACDFSNCTPSGSSGSYSQVVMYGNTFRLDGGGTPPGHGQAYLHVNGASSQ